MKTIYDIVSVNVFYQPKTQNYRVDAVGRVSTGGYTRPAIIGAGIIDDEGTLAYDFEAEPPAHGTMTTQAFETLKASATFGGPGTSLKGLKTVRVSAFKNSMDASFPPE